MTSNFRHCPAGLGVLYRTFSRLCALLAVLLLAGCAVGGLSGAGPGKTTTAINTPGNDPASTPNVTSLDKRSPVKVALLLPLS